MHTLTIRWDIWNTVLYDLRQNFLIHRISREMQQSITRMQKLRGQGSLNINGLNSAKDDEDRISLKQ